MRERDMILTARITQQNDPLLSYRCVRRSEIRKRVWYHGSSDTIRGTTLFHPLLHNHKHSFVYFSILQSITTVFPFVFSFQNIRFRVPILRTGNRQDEQANKHNWDQTNRNSFHPLHKKQLQQKHQRETWRQLLTTRTI